MKKHVNMIATLVALLCYGHSIAQTAAIYVSDAANFNVGPWKILKFDENGQNGSFFINENLAWPQDILFVEDSNFVLISNLNTNQIAKFNASTGAYIGDFATGISGPTRMKIGPDGLLYALQWSGNGKVFRYKLDGTLVDQFTSVGVGTSIGMDWDAAGNLYVASYSGKRIRKFSPSGADLGLFVNSNLSGPTNIWFDDNGRLVVIDYEGNGVKRFDATTGAYLGVFISGLANGEGIDFLPNGNLIIGNGANSSVDIYTPEGVFVSYLVPSGTLGLQIPNAVVRRELPMSPTTAPVENAAFVQPTLGNSFLIQPPDAWRETSSVSVYNAMGTLVQQWNLAESARWEAAGQPNGVYVLVLQAVDGKLLRQKVVKQ
jgi:hypothetical protein